MKGAPSGSEAGGTKPSTTPRLEWAVYTDFLWIARRHGIKDTDQAPFKTASGVIASITSSVKAR